MEEQGRGKNRAIVMLFAVAAVVTVWSAIRPHDYATWFFELMFGFIGLGVLGATYRKFPLSGVTYGAIGVFYVILAVGAKYTYAEMPLFDWLKDELGLARNHFDRVGHFMQGFVPALIARELFVRRTGLERGKMLGFVCISAPLSISAFYELLEWWWVLGFYREMGPEWLGHQGDMWDAQGDMFMALLGATVAVVFFSRMQDRSLAKRGIISGEAGGN